MLTALAYTLLLGPKLQTGENPRPHNMVNLLIGTTLIWLGSFGYNAGSGNYHFLYIKKSHFQKRWYQVFHL